MTAHKALAVRPRIFASFNLKAYAGSVHRWRRLLSIDSLTEQEQFSLVVLLKALITADGQVSQAENIEISHVARRLDPGLFRRAETIVFTGRSGLKSFLRTVTRQYARDCIYDILLEVAQADGIQAEESQILDDVADAWDIVVVTGHGSGGSDGSVDAD